MNPIDHALQILESHASDEVVWQLEIPVLGDRKPFPPQLRSNFRLFGLALIPTAQALEKHQAHLDKIISWEETEHSTVRLRLVHLVSGNDVIPVNALIRVPRHLFVQTTNPATPLQYLYPRCIRIANRLLPALGIPDVPDFQVNWKSLVEQYNISNLQGSRLFRPRNFYETVLALHFLLSTQRNLKRNKTIRLPRNTWLYRTIGGVLEALSDSSYAVAALRLAYICADIMAYMYIKTTTRSVSRLYYLSPEGLVIQAAHKQKPPPDRVDTYIDLRSSLFLENGGTMPRPWVNIALEPNDSNLLFIRTELVYNEVTDTVHPHMMVLLSHPAEGSAFLVEATQLEPEIAEIRYTLATISAGTTGKGETYSIAGELVSLGTDIHAPFKRHTRLKLLSIFHTPIQGRFTAYLDVLPRLPARTAALLERITYLLENGIRVRVPTGQGGVTLHLKGAQLWLASSIGYVLDRPGISKYLVVRADTAWWHHLHRWLTCPATILVWRWFKTLLKNGEESAYGRAFHILTSRKLEPYMALSRNLRVQDVSPAPPVENLAQVKYSHPVSGSTVLHQDDRVPENRYGKPCVISMDDYRKFILEADPEQLNLAVELLRYIQPPP